MAFIKVADDAPIFVMMNAGSGKPDTDEKRAVIEETLASSGRKYEIILVEDGSELVAVAQRTVEKAKAQNGVVVMAGGDGSINAVAQIMLGSDCAFGVLPQGTFNYFSRTHGIPADTTEATRVLLGNSAESVQVAMVNGRTFLVNASLGLYPQLLEDRETYVQKYGRSRFVAFISGMFSVLRQHRQLHLALQEQGKARFIRTPTLFVGNNPLQLEQIGILDNEAMSGQLVAVTLRPVSTLGVLWLMICGTFGKLGEADNIISFKFGQLTVHQAGGFRTRKVKVALDGEIEWLSLPLEFSISSKPLYLLKPAS